jgi:hypothetical protein
MAKNVLKSVKGVLTEEKLSKLQVLRDKVDVLSADLAKANKELLVEEEDVLIKLREGYACVGRFVATIGHAMGQCRPPWKDLYLSIFPNKVAAEEDARARYPATEHEVLNLQVVPK